MRLVLANETAFEIGPRPLVVGSSARCDVRVEGAAPEHARIDGGDIEAIAPCSVGDVDLAPGERRRLVAGCSVDLGEARLRVDDEETSASRFTTRELALRGVDEPKRLWPSVIVVQGVAVGVELVLREERTFQVGRGTTSDLALEDVDVSRSHLEIIRLGDGVLVRDLGSTRGTLLGRARLDPKRKALWAPETMVKVGKTVLALASPSWTRGSSGSGLTSNAAAGPVVTTGDEGSADDESTRAPPQEAARVPVGPVAAPTGAIAEVPHAAGVREVQRSRTFDRLFVGVMVAIVGLALAGLAWVLWP